MQRALVALRIGAVPIIKAIGNVAGLLNLIQQDAAANGVHHAGGNVKHIASLYGHKAQKQLQRRLGFKGLAQHIARNARTQAVYQLRARLGGQDDPGFGFA